MSESQRALESERDDLRKQNSIMADMYRALKGEAERKDESLIRERERFRECVDDILGMARTEAQDPAWSPAAKSAFARFADMVLQRARKDFYDLK